MFDADGRKVSTQTVRRCVDAGWAEPWFANPTKPDWLVCRLTELGRSLLDASEPAAADALERHAAPSSGP